MRHRRATTNFGRESAPRLAMMRNLATSLVLYDKIQTTEAKAKALRPLIEKYITKAAKNDLATRRQLLKFFTTEGSVRKLMDELGPRYKERSGGYTRITKIGVRQGDNSPIVQIEFV